MRKLVGAHVSTENGLENVPFECTRLHAGACAFFLTDQQTWKHAPLRDRTTRLFQKRMHQINMQPQSLLPHGSYLMNLGSPNLKTLLKSRDTFNEELRRCEKLGILTYNFHPGSSLSKITARCCSLVSESINLAHALTDNIVTVIENMSCQGATVGGKFAELRLIIDNVQNKSRVGICLDTCHIFAAGYDIRTEDAYQETMHQFEIEVGFRYLKGVHLNDSKSCLASHLDRHENIGKGKIGFDAFKFIMNDERFDGIPMILEIPTISARKSEIALLKSFCH